MRKNRKINELRKIEIIPNFSPNAEGSCLIKCGETHVLCNASVDENIPRWLKGQDRGWITAEYGMLPRSTLDRMNRESKLGKQSGRTQEIQRLIGRSLRSVVDLHKLKNYQVIIDCDVLQADGGTRTAAITGPACAIEDAVDYMLEKKLINESPIIHKIAAISAGIVNNEIMIDLDYNEDSNCETDMNIIMTDDNKFIEIQGTAEGAPFSIEELNQLLSMSQNAITSIFETVKK